MLHNLLINFAPDEGAGGNSAPETETTAPVVDTKPDEAADNKAKLNLIQRLFGPKETVEQPVEPNIQAQIDAAVAKALAAQVTPPEKSPSPAPTTDKDKKPSVEDIYAQYSELSKKFDDLKNENGLANKKSESKSKYEKLLKAAPFLGDTLDGAKNDAELEATLRIFEAATKELGIPEKTGKPIVPGSSGAPSETPKNLTSDQKIMDAKIAESIKNGGQTYNLRTVFNG